MTTNTDTPTVAAKPARTRRGEAAVETTTPPGAKTASKSETVIKMLLRSKGATPAELILATDWQAHSVRAFLSGLRKKGRTILRETRKSGEFAYRIASPAPAYQEPLASSPESTIGDTTLSDPAQA